jgi:hypothetical protein
MKQIAQGLAALGRGEDKMLVHMTPREVSGLQQLALAHGGSLTINPHTGLPEAGFLSSLLPMAIGAALTPVMGPMGAALLVGGGMTAISGSLQKGLMAGLGAYGGGELSKAFVGMGEAQAAAAQQAATEASTKAAESQIGDVITKAEALPSGIEKPLAYPGEQYVPGGPTTYTEPITYARPENFATNPYTPEGVKYMQQSGMSPDQIRQSFMEQAGQQGPAPTALGKGDAMMSGIKQLGEKGGPSELYSRLGKSGTLAVAAPVAMAGIGALTSQQPKLPGMAAASPAQIRPYTYSPGQVNPRFGEPGQPYFLGQGYTAGTPYTAAHGGIVALASGGTIPGAEYENPVSAAEAQVARLSAAQLSQLAEESDDATLQAAAVKEMQKREATQRAPKSQFMKMADGGLTALQQQTRDYLNNLQAQLAGAPAGIVSTRIPMATTPAPAGSIGGYSYDPRTQTFGYTPPPAPEPEKVEAPSAASAYDGDYAGGLKSLAGGGTTYAAAGRLLRGDGDGMSDSIPAVLQTKEPKPAALADGEFVVPADVVSHLGNGSTEAGAKRLYNMMDRVRKARTGSKRQAPAVKAAKYLPA